MKYKVVKNFQDKYTKDYYGIDSTYETENIERGEELERGGFVVPEDVQATQANKTATQASKENQTSNKNVTQSQKYTILDETHEHNDKQADQAKQITQAGQVKQAAQADQVTQVKTKNKTKSQAQQHTTKGKVDK